ncbi:hypothetical protein OESDEN_06690 [Oesophagostomum dentatum]|uniref:RRM domain-containing protein n=1 Tax=Oesophagostomum dentatum TaxID=61180 RepID=A0A0B1TDF6_OESDE|nr:hypothetical protein OESDEN_06690 [Oesophagostomum dentatum]
MGDSSSTGTGEKRAHETSADSPEIKIEEDIRSNAVERSDFVVVADSSGEAMELPTAPDNSLYMTTLQATYPGATGMKYKNPKTGALRAVAVDATGTKLLPPADGWEDKVFTVITSNSRSDRGSDVSVKRRKIGTSDGESDSDGEGRVGRKRAADSREAAEPPVPRRPVDLIVLGVNYKTTDEGFKSYFEAFGTVVFAEIKRTPEGSSKGFGFVQMSTVEEQDKVLATANHMLDGRRCDVRIPEQRVKHDGNTPGGSRTVVPPKTLVNKVFVGRLSEKIEDETLRKFFDKEAKRIVDSASVTDVFIPRPFRGFAFITFTHSEVADRLCKENNFVIDGTSVSVTLAVPREDPHQNGAFYNDFGFPYGYAKGGAGFGSGIPSHSPFPAGRDMFGYSPPPGAYGRPPYDGWVPPPTMQGTPRSSRSGPPAHEQPCVRTRYHSRGSKEATFPGPVPAPGPSPVGPPPLAYVFQQRDGLAGQAASNQIASGLDALNLNQMNPDLLNTAWNAFFSTLNHGGASPQPRKW